MQILNKLKLQLVDFFRKTDALELYKEFLETQWLPKERMREMQWQRIKDLLDHAYTNVPYYHKLFNSIRIKPDNIKSIDDFSRIPILTKDIIRANAKDMLATNNKVFQPYKKGTGGSTGNPLLYYMDRKSRSANWATMYRQWHIGGWTPGDKIVYLGGSSIYPSINALMKWFYIRLNNWLFLSAFDMSDENMKLWLKKIKRWKGRFMHAYASSAYLLAKYLEYNDIKDISFEAVFTSAEPLYPKYRYTIKKIFSCEVFDLYGANDGGGYAFECEEHNGLHCVSERAFIEVLKEDGTMTDDGEIGEIVSTDLLNYAMPFIRYKVEDNAILDPNPCKCGRRLPLLKKIQGRSHDFVTSKNGQKVHGEYFAHLIRGIDWIAQFQVVQETPVVLSIFLKPDRQPSNSQIKRVKDLLQSKFNGMNIRVNLTDSVHATKGGKFKYIINKTLE